MVNDEIIVFISPLIKGPEKFSGPFITFIEHQCL